MAEPWDYTILFSKTHHPKREVTVEWLHHKILQWSMNDCNWILKVLTCMTSQSRSDHKQTNRCWIPQKPWAAEVWPASRTPISGWRSRDQPRPPSRRRNHRWRSSSASSPDAGLQSPDRSWRWPAMPSLPFPWNRTEINITVRDFVGLRIVIVCSLAAAKLHTIRVTAINDTEQPSVDKMFSYKR